MKDLVERMSSGKKSKQRSRISGKSELMATPCPNAKNVKNMFTTGGAASTIDYSSSEKVYLTR